MQGVRPDMVVRGLHFDTLGIGAHQTSLLTGSRDMKLEKLPKLPVTRSSCSLAIKSSRCSSRGSTSKARRATLSKRRISPLPTNYVITTDISRIDLEQLATLLAKEKCAYDLVDANKRVDLIRRALDCSTNWAAVLMKKKNKEMVVVGFVRAVSDLSLIATLHDLFVSPDSGCEPVQVLEAMLERVVRDLRRSTGIDDIAVGADPEIQSLLSECGFGPDKLGSVFMVLKSGEYSEQLA